jgi:hypothetical protein
MKLILVVVCLLPVFAVPAQGRRAAEAAALEAQLRTAEVEGAAAAVRPGDEDLTCQQLQDEIVAAAQSPELQAALQPFAEQAQSDQAQVEEAQQQIEEQTQGRRRGGGGGGGLFRSLAQGAATAALPNSVGASAQMAAAAAQAAQMQRQAAQNQDQIFGAAQGAVGMMGTAMRGQRVMELAEAKKCEWLNGDSFGTPAAAPEPPAEGARR